MSPRAMEIKENINKLDYIKRKIFCIAKDTINKIKWEPAVWVYIFPNDKSGKELISKIYK